MSRLISRIAPIATALLLLTPHILLAQNAPPVRVRGTIESVTSTSLTVKARDGAVMTITLNTPLTIGTVLKASMDDIKAGDFVGSAAMKGADGKLHAMEVHIFPEAMRGTGEGQRGWDAGPDSSMTNATVGEVVAAPSGHTLKLTYKDGTADIEVAPDVPVVKLAPGTADMIQPGRAVMLFAAKQSDGSLSASRLTVESNGVKPPM